MANFTRQNLIVFEKRNRMLNIRFFILNLFLILSQVVWAQKTIIIGTIVDEDSLTLPFVSVVFTGTNVGASSDFDGKFRIENSGKVDSLSFKSLGFSDKTIAIKQGESQEIQVVMEVKRTTLNVVVIKSQENPSWKIMRKVLKARKGNDYRTMDYVQYENYTKIEVDVDNISEEFKEKKLMKKLNETLEEIEMLTDEEGNEILPVFISESVSDFYFKSNPIATKEYVKATKITGVGVEDGSLVSQFAGSSFQKFDFYDNTLNILGKDFISPISAAWKDSYVYFLEDSLTINDRWCYRLDIEPKRKQDLAFYGTIYIDSETFALVKVDLEVKKEANLNYIEHIKFQEEWQPSGLGPWVEKSRRVLIDLGDISDSWASMLIQSSTSKSNYVFGEVKDKKFFEYPIEVDEKAKEKGNEYFTEYRKETFTDHDKAAYALVDSVKNLPVVRSYIDVANVFINGYRTYGKVDVGRYLFLYAYNNVEGHRITPGFKTNVHFSRKFVIKGYLGYTTRDQKMKYSFDFKWIADKKPWTEVGYKITSDVNQLGITGLLNNNLFEAGSRWGTLKGAYYFDENQVYVSRQISRSFSQKVSFKNFFMNPVFGFKYYTDGSEVATASTITQSEVEFEGRFSKDEIIIVNDNERIRMGSKWPTFTLKVGLGIDGVLNSQFEYQKVDLGIDQDVSLGRIGHSNYLINAGKIYGTIPFPLLNVALGNQTPIYTLVSFNLMNYFEFVTDQYSSLKWEHHFEGFFLNRIPLMKKLKWRLVANTAVLYGSVNNANFDIIPDEEGVIKFNTLGDVPYVEAGYGIENILKVFRIQAFHRITYRDAIDANNFGIKGAFQFNF